MENQKANREIDLVKINQALNFVCNQSLGVLDSSFLCQSLGVLNPHRPLCVVETDTVEKVLKTLREARVGCVLVLNEAKTLTGIFSERDCLLKVVPDFAALQKRPVVEVMTRDPITQPIDTTIGFALTVMSQGGFRHLPIVDDSGFAIGIISVKDVIDYIVNRFVDDALAFKIPESN